jgi:hypothetical protein
METCKQIFSKNSTFLPQARIFIFKHVTNELR